MHPCYCNRQFGNFVVQILHAGIILRLVKAFYELRCLIKGLVFVEL